jgi:hypothetical protein
MVALAGALLSVAAVAQAEPTYPQTRIELAQSGMADSYRQAAQAYRDAASKAPADQKQCYLNWARYYDCVVGSLRSGSSSQCREPSCKPGS